MNRNWYYQNEPVDQIPLGVVGFVYKITNLHSGKKYIGKKLVISTRTKQQTVQLKSGIKKKKRVKIQEESNWRTYWGSCDQLTKDIELLGEQWFKKDILRWCMTRGECSYYEAKEQFIRQVLESDEWYNGHIQVRVHRNHIKV